MVCEGCAGNTMAVYTGTSSALKLSEQHLYGSSRLGVWNRDVDMDAGLPNNYTFTRGYKFFELSNHLGNVLATINDVKSGVDDNSDGEADRYLANVVGANDYYPFGMLMPGRSYSAGNQYRYGFNGKENDNDVKGEGNQQDYGMRIYDPRLGKFLSVDPITKKYPWYTPYSFAGNKPIEAIDIDGSEEAYTRHAQYQKNQSLLRMQSEDANKPQIKAFDPTKEKWTTKWKNSDNFFAKIGYDIVNGFYTTGQQFSSSLTGEKYIHNLGGGFYESHGAFGEKERTTHFVDAVTTLLPSAPVESKAVSLFNKASNVAVQSIERETTQTVVNQISKKVGWTGKIGENYLKSLGGVSQKYFETTVGQGGRFVDQFVNGVAYESKVGYTTLTKHVQMQIAKDVELLANKVETGVEKVVWTFFESPVTGKAGASKPLLDALKKAGIETQIIRK